MTDMLGFFRQRDVGASARASQTVVGLNVPDHDVLDHAPL